MGIDEKARALLQQLPEEKQVDLVNCLRAKIQSGTCMNPSGWMVNSCIGAGAQTESIAGGKPITGDYLMRMSGMGGMGGTGSMGGGDQVVAMAMMVIDDRAQSLFQQLPEEKQ